MRFRQYAIIPIFLLLLLLLSSYISDFLSRSTERKEGEDARAARFCSFVQTEPQGFGTQQSTKGQGAFTLAAVRDAASGKASLLPSAKSYSTLWDMSLMGPEGSPGTRRSEVL